MNQPFRGCSVGRLAAKLSLLASLAALFPCVEAAGQTASQVARSSPSEPPPTLAARTVTDEAGRQVTVPAKVDRVVSLAPNVTDILYAIGASEKIAAITDFTQLPFGAAPKPSVGEPLDPNLERIVAAKPDLVFVAQSANRLETVESLDKLGVPVYATESRTVMGMLATVRDVADMVGESAAGRALAAQLEARLEAVRARLAGQKPKRVLFVVWQDPLITTGRNTFIADALRWAGAESVANTGQDWPHLGLEAVVNWQPDSLIFPGVHITAAEIDRSLATEPGWRDLRAVQQGNVVVVSDAINRPSPALVGAIETLARALHPAAFADESPEPAAVKPPAMQSSKAAPPNSRKGLSVMPMGAREATAATPASRMQTGTRAPREGKSA